MKSKIKVIEMIEMKYTHRQRVNTVERDHVRAHVLNQRERQLDRSL